MSLTQYARYALAPDGERGSGVPTKVSTCDALSVSNKSVTLRLRDFDDVQLESLLAGDRGLFIRFTLGDRQISAWGKVDSGNRMQDGSAVVQVNLDGLPQEDARFLAAYVQRRQQGVNTVWSKNLEKLRRQKQIKRMAASALVMFLFAGMFYLLFVVGGELFRFRGSGSGSGKLGAEGSRSNWDNLNANSKDELRDAARELFSDDEIHRMKDDLKDMWNNASDAEREAIKREIPKH